MRGTRWWGGLRVLVVVAWVVAAAVSWWTTPRESAYERARADIAGGRVVAYQWGDNWADSGSSWWFGDRTLYSSGTLGPLFAWRTGDGRVHWIDEAAVGEAALTGAVDPKDYAGPGAAALGQDIQAAGAGERLGDVSAGSDAVGPIGFVLSAVFLMVLVAGPAPVLGTRWYWFWLVLASPYGLGLLFWLVRDRPWSARADGEGDPRRDRWLLGLATGVLLSVAVSVVLFLLHRLLGETWVPR